MPRTFLICYLYTQFVGRKVKHFLWIVQEMWLLFFKVLTRLLMFLLNPYPLQTERGSQQGFPFPFVWMAGSMSPPVGSLSEVRRVTSGRRSLRSGRRAVCPVAFRPGHACRDGGSQDVREESSGRAPACLQRC